jgi:hypothetical protein
MISLASFAVAGKTFKNKRNGENRQWLQGFEENAAV